MIPESMPHPQSARVSIERDAPIATWLGVGGRADRLARPRSVDELRACLAMDRDLLVLGDGANLLVCDEGVERLVVDLREMNRVEIAAVDGRAVTEVVAEAGARLPRLITDTVRAGLAGLEGLGGIPASIGGAIFMNAGGAFGEIGNAVRRVRVMDRDGSAHDLPRERIDFGYRHSGLAGRIIIEAEFALTPMDAVALRDRLKDVMAYKKSSQPLADDSAGCIFKNPTLSADLPGLGTAGQRISAGMLIDRAGCKGLRVGAAVVSHGHANFIVVEEGGTADDVMQVMSQVQRRVLERFGVRLDPEVVVWEREP